jgi:glycosyltransferase involved in cell wall biosynthesis
MTFFIPSDNRSGGIRVTVRLANELVARGHRVRIALPVTSLRTSWRLLLSRSLAKLRYDQERTGWVHDFTGTVLRYRHPKQIEFAPRELCVAVGTKGIPPVSALGQEVRKLRYNHGLNSKMGEDELKLWRLRIPTITVSNTLCAEIKELTGEEPLCVVPNGIDTSEYFTEPGVLRDGIGTIYATHPSKGPDSIRQVLRGCATIQPQYPLYVFGTDEPPFDPPLNNFLRFPSVAQARRLYCRSLVWFLASHSEGFGLPILEGMSCGCTIVATDTAAGRELIRDGDNGLLVPRRDSAGMITRIGELLSNPGLRAKLNNRAQATVQLFSWERSAGAFEAIAYRLYQSVSDTVL